MPPTRCPFIIASARRYGCFCYRPLFVPWPIEADCLQCAMSWNLYYQQLHKPTMRKRRRRSTRPTSEREPIRNPYSSKHVHVQLQRHQAQMYRRLGSLIIRCHGFDISDDRKQVCDKCDENRAGSCHSCRNMVYMRSNLEQAPQNHNMYLGEFPWYDAPSF